MSACVFLRIFGVGLNQGHSISSPWAKSVPQGPNNWPAEQYHYVESIYSK